MKPNSQYRDSSSSPKAKPRVKREHCVTLWHALADGKFHKARELPLNNRLIRAVCAEHPQHFLSTQKGYKRADKATLNEIRNSIADLRSRITHIDKRASALEDVLAERGQHFGLMVVK